MVFGHRVEFASVFDDQHGIKPVIDATYPFAQIPDAFVHVVRGAFGKIVANVGQS